MEIQKVTEGFKAGQLYVAGLYSMDDDSVRYGSLAVFGADGEWYDADSLEHFPHFDFDFCVEQTGAFYKELAYFDQLKWR